MIQMMQNICEWASDCLYDLSITISRNWKFIAAMVVILVVAVGGGWFLFRRWFRFTDNEIMLMMVAALLMIISDRLEKRHG